MSETKIPKGYKRTEVGVIPEEWTAIDLIDMCTLQRGFDITESTRTHGEIPVYSSSGISYYHSKAMAKPPGVVTGRKGILGKVFLIDVPYWPHDTTLWVKDFKGNSPAFVALVFQKFRLERLDASTSVPTLNRNNLAGHRVAFPPNKEEQRAIATALSDVDALIAGLDQLIVKKRDLKQAAMQQLLTGQKRLPGFQGEWQEKKLKEIGDFKNGINKSAEDFGHGSPFVNLMDVFGIPAISNNSGFGLIKTTETEQATYELKRGDVVFIRSSVKPSGVGLTSVIENDLPKTVYSGFLIRFRDRDSLDIGFKKHCFFEEGFRRRLISASSVSANTNINQDNLGLLSISLPPTRSEQTAIATILSDMDSELTALEQRSNKTRALKQGMMQELLTGKTRLL